MTIRRRSLVIGWLLFALALAACGSSSGKADVSAAPGTTAAPRAGDQKAFCAALVTIQTSTDPAAIFAAYDTMEATAPADIAGYVTPFVAAAREVSTASKNLPAKATQDDMNAMINGLSPQGKALVAALSKTAKTGLLPDGAVGTVLSYGQAHCQG